MTKIYLVISGECTSNGIALYDTRKIFQVFTNRKLATKAVDYLNKSWREAFKTKNFKGIKWYCIKTYAISHLDYSKLSF